jgi:hypothetical protein
MISCSIGHCESHEIIDRHRGYRKKDSQVRPGTFHDLYATLLSILNSVPLQVKRIIGQRDARLKKNQDKGEIENKKKVAGSEVVREMCAPSPPHPAVESIPAKLTVL